MKYKKDDSYNINIFYLILDATQNLWVAKQRSILALLGIIIGTASVISMLSIGSMAEHELLRHFQQMGVNVFVIQRAATVLGPSDTTQTDGLDLNIIAMLPTTVPNVLRISPLRTGSVRIGARIETQELSLAAVWPAIQDISGLRIRKGRFLAPIDQNNFVAVLGSTAADQLAESGRPSSVGATIHLGRYVFTIIGIIQKAPENTYTPIDFNKSVMVPLEISDRVLGHGSPNAAMGLMKAGSDSESVSSNIDAVFARVNPDAPVRVQGARALIEALRAQRALQTRMFVALAAVSLFVGGIGVMNVMLMSVMERRKEIGLRTAIGATPQIIQFSFLIEAAVLSGLGGICGSLIGVILAFGIGVRSNWAFQLPFYALPFSAGLAVCTGIVFGVVPALKASRLDPMEALRAE